MSNVEMACMYSENLLSFSIKVTKMAAIDGKLN